MLLAHAPSPAPLSPQDASLDVHKYLLSPRPFFPCFLVTVRAFSSRLCGWFSRLELFIRWLGERICTPCLHAPSTPPLHLLYAPPARPSIWTRQIGLMVLRWSFGSLEGPIPSLARLPSCKATRLELGRFFFFYFTERLGCRFGDLSSSVPFDIRWVQTNTYELDASYDIAMSSCMHDATIVPLAPDSTPGHSSGANPLDPSLIYTNSNPRTNGGYNEAALEAPLGSMSSYSNDPFSVSSFSYNDTAGTCGHLQGNSIPAQGYTYDSLPTGIPPPQIPSTSVTEYACTHPGCTKKFTRNPDMLRHAKVHDPNAARFDCSFPGCRRRGGQGFPRHDKLLAHERAHRRAIQKARDRAARHQ